MTHKVRVLDYAKIDYREIRKWVRMEFGEHVWTEVEAEFNKLAMVNRALLRRRHHGASEGR